MELSKKEKRIVDLAQSGGTDKELLFLESLNEIEDKLDVIATKPEPEDKLEIMHDHLTILVEDIIAAIKESEKEVKITNDVTGLVDRITSKIVLESRVDFAPLLTSLSAINQSLKKDDKEEIDYSPLLNEIKNAIPTVENNPKIEEIAVTLTDFIERFEKVINNNRLKVEVDRVGEGGRGFIGGGGGGLTPDQLRTTVVTTTTYFAGASANGTRDLTSANTWYAVPSTVPTSPYILVATVENSVGTVRFAFDNTGTPSSTNGNQAPSQLTVRLAANQVIYYASSSAGDDVNWTTKVI